MPKCSDFDFKLRGKPQFNLAISLYYNTISKTQKKFTFQFFPLFIAHAWTGFSKHYYLYLDEAHNVPINKISLRLG